MRLRRDRMGFIFSLDAALAMLVVMVAIAGVARIAGPELTYGQHGYLRLGRYANDALEVMQLTGATDNIMNLLAEGNESEAENFAENELQKILPREIQFKLRIGSEDSPRLNIAYPDQAAFESAEGIVAAARVLAFTYQLDQNNPNRTEGKWHEIRDKKWCAQTFVAGRAGKLVKVALYLKREGNPGDLTIEIRDCAGADSPPGNTILASMTTGDVTSETGREYVFTFTSPASVTAGTYYAIVLHEPEDVGGVGDGYQWSEYQPSDKYPEGHAWRSNDSGKSWEVGGGGIHDFYFRTYVSIPPENMFDPITLYVWRGAKI